MKECRFKPGDRVDINIKLAPSGTKLKTALAGLRLLKIIFGPRVVRGWVVTRRRFDKRLRQWIVWVKSPAGVAKGRDPATRGWAEAQRFLGEVQRFEERLLIKRLEKRPHTQP